jgi:predicted XRE-type DNA-binding protein
MSREGPDTPQPQQRPVADAVGCRRPDPAVWEEAVMRRALAAHDIATVYRLLGRLGFSQQRIAELTGQGQSEVSAILHGRRVISYQVLSRIADGLGIPRGYLGLSWCACPAGEASFGPQAPAPSAAVERAG